MLDLGSEIVDCDIESVCGKSEGDVPADTLMMRATTSG